MIRPTNTRSSGFTLIELMFALSFVAFLLIFTVFATVQIMRSYGKGVTIKEINQAARGVVEDMSRVARATNGQSINVSAVNQGRLCFGGVSYIWNTQGGNNNVYDDNSAVSLARVDDPAGALCNITDPGPPQLPLITRANATPILSGRIWVQNVTATLNSDKSIVTFSIKLSTSGDNQPTYNDPQLGLICSGDQNGQYCAVATFSTTVTTRNGGQ